MSISQFFSILRARWLTAMATLFIVVTVVVGASLVWPKKYSATASVVIDVKPDPVSAMMYPGMTSPAFMATQVDILMSERVAQRVVSNLKLTQNPQVREQWQAATGGQGSIETWLGGSLLRGMDVKPSRESNVLTVTYKSNDPRFASGLANAFVQAYMDTVLEMRVNPARQYSSFFDDRLKAAREALEAAQAKHSAFQKDNGIFATDERLDVESARMNELSSQVVALQGISAESSSRQGQAQGASADKLLDVLNNPVVIGLKSDLHRAEAQLQQLSARYGDSHPQVIEIKANIAEVKTRLEQETRRVTGGVGVTNTINRQREAQVRAELDAQRAKVMRMKSVRDQGVLLARDVDNAQRAYDAVQARLSQTSLESQANQSNIYPLTMATPPSEPSSPRVAFNALLATFAGSLLGVVLAMLRELFDRRVRDQTDVVAALGLQVLGVLPDGTKRPGMGKAARLQQRVVNRITGPSASRA